MLLDFLLENESEILLVTEQKSSSLAGVRPSSDQLKQGLPIFFKQLISTLRESQTTSEPIKADQAGMARAASESNETAMTTASDHPNDLALATSAGFHGEEMLRLGYTLSHVVHAYGALCQAITDLATKKNLQASYSNFRDLNRCLDVAIASAVTHYESVRDIRKVSKEVERCGFCAHELRNALNGASISFQLIKSGVVGISGSTGLILERSFVPSALDRHTLRS